MNTIPHPASVRARVNALLGSPVPYKIPAKRKPARDPVVIAAEKAYHASNQYALDKLLRVEKRYAVRLGKAEAGLRKTRKQIRALLLGCAKDKLPNPVEVNA